MACGCIVSVFFGPVHKRCLCLLNEMIYNEKRAEWFFFPPKFTHSDIYFHQRVSHGYLCLWLSNFLFFAFGALFILFAISFAPIQWTAFPFDREMDCLCVRWITPVEGYMWLNYVALYLWPNGDYDFRYTLYSTVELTNMSSLASNRKAENII